VRGSTSLEGVGCPPFVGATRRVAPTSLWGEGWGERYIPLEGVGCLPSVGATRRVAPTSLWGEKYIPLEGEAPAEPLVREGGLRLYGSGATQGSPPTSDTQVAPYIGLYAHG
jgi:hypothetical protein